ncbi:glycosyltransferase [Paraburkholderia sp. BR10954]|uniref:glycosyltransferase n=1 Tax=Paraburkholderia sp. BR10954 TaxID=3236995 RepID=UPI0034D17AA4
MSESNPVAESELYDEEYYKRGCGPIPYDRSVAHWGEFFGKIADELIRTFRVRRVFDAGCAKGFLVEALWERGVSAFGRDVSRYAISEVRADVRKFCSVGSLTEAIQDSYDLITCIEVLEHMPEDEALLAIANMTAAADIVVFSSSPSDFDEPTHVNVRPTIYWMRAFAKHCFVPLIETTLFSITPYALAFQRRDEAPTDDYLFACAEVVRFRIKQGEEATRIHELSVALNERAAEVTRQRETAERELANLRAQSERAEQEAARDREAAERELANLRAQSERLEQDQAATEATLACVTAERDAVTSSITAVSERAARLQAFVAGQIDVNAHYLGLVNLIQYSRSWRAYRKILRILNRFHLARASEQLIGNLLGLAKAGRLLGFDREFYLEQYPEIARAGVDPLQHYLVQGRAEGRVPSRVFLEDVHGRTQHRPQPIEGTCSPLFDAARQNLPDNFDRNFYLKTYPDVLQAGVDPLEHYLRYGRGEGRLPNETAKGLDHLFVLHDFCDPTNFEPGERTFDQQFLVTVLTPTYNTAPRYLYELFQTLLNQKYGNWEWIIVDDGSSDPTTIATLSVLASRDERVRVHKAAVNSGISAASNKALSLSSGTHIALVDHDDLIARDAFLSLYEAWKCAPSTDLFYTDECKLLPDGSLDWFWTKPDWSPAYLENTMCIGHLSAYRADFLRDLGGFRSDYDGTQDFDLALRASLRKPSVVHLPCFAYLWRVIPGSAALDLEQKPYAIERQGKAVLDYARHKHRDARVIRGWGAGYWRIIYPLPKPTPLLSFVIPTGGGSRMVRGRRVDLIVNCIASFVRTGFYPNAEYVVVHNGNLTKKQLEALKEFENIRLVHYDKEAFNFSEKLNIGVSAAAGEYICPLNDDVEAITAGGGEQLVGYLSANPNVGCIGPKCLREDDTIQQNGVVLLDNIGPAHSGDGMGRDFGGHHEMLRCRREVFCIGGAIMFLRKELYETLGGFDEKLPLNYNDVDFGVRLRERGYSCVVDPSIEVYHFEGATKIGTNAVEQERFFLKHPGVRDPYFSRWFDPGNPNFRQKLRSETHKLAFGAWLDRHIAARAANYSTRGLHKLSVCVSVYDQPKRLLEEMYKSVVMQTYANWELVIVDNGSSNAETLRWLEYVRAEAIATVFRIDSNAGISGANRKLLDTLTGDYLVALDADDFLSVDALQILASAIEANPHKKLFYTDEYKSDMHSTRFSPFFKPDFDPILLMNCCYPAHLMAMEATFLRQVGAYSDDEATWCHDYDTLTRALAIGEEPVHVRELTYAWRINPGSTASAETSAKPGTTRAQKFVLERMLANRALDGSVMVTPNTIESSSGMWRLKALHAVPNVEVFGTDAVWGPGGAGVDGLVAAANGRGLEWVAVVNQPNDPDALMELSAIALFDPRILAVSGLLLGNDGTIRWSGGVFLPDGRVLDPYYKLALAAGGDHARLWCQRCVDFAAPANVLIRASVLREIGENRSCASAEELMLEIGRLAHENEKLVAVTPHLVGQSDVALPIDRARRVKSWPRVTGGSRWYDGRLEYDRPYKMPGLA